MRLLPGNLITSMLAWPRALKVSLVVAADIVVISAALFFAQFLVNGGGAAALGTHLLLYLLLACLASILFGNLFGLYRSVTRYADGQVISRAGVNAIATGLAIAMPALLLGQLAQIWQSLVVYVLLAATLMGGWRVLAASILGGPTSTARGEAVVIYGAGQAGRQLAIALQRGEEFRPLAFIDDRVDLVGRAMMGLRVCRRDAIPKLKERGVSRVLLAMPTISLNRRRQILKALEPYALQVMAMPSFDELASGRKRVDDLREVQIEDLLGRDPVQPDTELMQAFTRGCSVLITGGGGSIGAELARQVMLQGVRKLVVLDNCEYALYQIDRELRQLREQTNSAVRDTDIVPALGSVLDSALLTRIMREHAVDTVYHAAAYKHVPLVEINAIAGIRNNVFGTRSVAECAAECGVKHFVLVSTDKAVRPTNVMGATKRAAELVVQQVAARQPQMRTAIVRFGNVLASSGSVIPLFKQQLAEGGPITVTHPNVTRYFMTIPEAAELVIQAGAMGQHGEIFLLEMGEPVKVVDLAIRLIHLAGMDPVDPATGVGDIAIRFTGLRPGEKMIEELLVDGNSSPTGHPRIFRAVDEGVTPSVLGRFVNELTEYVKAGDRDRASNTVMAIASGEFEKLIVSTAPAENPDPSSEWARNVVNLRSTSKTALPLVTPPPGT